MRTEPTPWRNWLRAASAFGIEPKAFWQLSMREWRALTASPNPAMSRAVFEALAQNYPDERNDE